MVWCVVYGGNHEVVDKLETGEAKGPSKPIITNVSACRGAAGGSKATSDIL